MLTKIYEQNPSERELRKVVDALEDGGIIIYPTDSVYAFGCSLRSPKAIERLRRMKGKDAETFTVVFENLAQAAEYCRVDNAAFRILKRNPTRRSKNGVRSESVFPATPFRGLSSRRWDVRLSPPR